MRASPCVPPLTPVPRPPGSCESCKILIYFSSFFYESSHYRSRRRKSASFGRNDDVETARAPRRHAAHREAHTVLCPLRCYGGGLHCQRIFARTGYVPQWNRSVKRGSNG